jgi:hypothetical protein
MSSVCRVRVEGGSKKIGSVSSGSVQVGSQKMKALCRRRFEGGTKKQRQWAREMSVVAVKKTLMCRRIVEGDTQKKRQGPRQGSRVAAKKLHLSAGKLCRLTRKNCVSVLEKNPEW